MRKPKIIERARQMARIGGRDRGVSVVQGHAIIGIIGLSVMWLVAQEFWIPLKAEADDQVVNATGQQATDWIGIAFSNYLVFGLAVIILGSIAAAAFKRQGGF